MSSMTRRRELAGFIGTPVVTLALCAAALVACESDGSVSSVPDADPVPAPDAGDEPVKSKCVAPTGAGTIHDRQDLASDDEVWTAAGSPHVVDFPPTIREGQKLTLEPCAVVRFAAGVGMSVAGELIAEGKVDQPIVLERAEADPWAHIRVNDTAHARFAYVTLEGGGYISNSRPDTTAMLYVDGDSRSPAGVLPLVRVDHVIVKGSQTLGVLLTENAAFTDDSRDLTITGSGAAPIRVWQRAAPSLPTGSYTGNQDDQILLEQGGYGNSAIVGEVTLHDRGLPYHVISSLRVGDSGDARTPGTLTVEPGITLRFQKGSVLSIEAYTADEAATGTLRAIGTPDKPIVFTSDSATPTPGDWVGITFKGTPSPNNRIEHATIAYAGGDSGISSYDCFVSPDERGFSNHAAVVFFGNQPAAAFIAHTRIENSAQDGIVRGWTGEPVDFLGTNQFVGVSRCWQTFPKPVSTSCPAPPPCPK
ncbi:MAG: Fibronectin type domain protein [Labilithrix sp.]|nr:Fibronectin type domain protein [Labilithrix sp.]